MALSNERCNRWRSLCVARCGHFVFCRHLGRGTSRCLDFKAAQAWLALFIGALLVKQAVASTTVGCYCKFPSDGNVTEPLWVCAGGYRQYRCLQKVAHGARYVARGSDGDVPVDYSFCSHTRTREPCQKSSATGFSLTLASTWRATANQTVEVMCPFDIDCTNATGFLAPSCSWGPNPNITVEELRFISSEARMVLQSPTKTDVAYALPFGHIAAIHGDAIMVADPTFRRLWTFHRSADDATLWNNTPSASFSYPGMLVFEEASGNSAKLEMSATAIIGGTFQKDALSDYHTSDEKDAWEAIEQVVYIFPRSARGAWGVEAPVTLGGIVYGDVNQAAGYGYAVAICDNYAIVSSKHRQIYASQVGSSFTGLVWIYQRVGGVWGTTAVHKIDAYRTTAGFGEILAIGDGDDRNEGIALVGSPEAGEVRVFERTAGSWPSTGQRLPAGRVSAMAISGPYFIVGDSATSTARLYERGAGGASSTRWGLKATFELDAYQPAVGAAAHFASAVALHDRGDGYAFAVVGGWASRRAVVFVRSASTGTWATGPDDRMELFVNQGVLQNPDGFGRAVGVSGGTVIVGSDSKRVYIFTEQLVGSIMSTPAVPFQGQGPQHQLVFDFTFLKTGIGYELCVDLDGEGAEEDFKPFPVHAIVTIPIGSGKRLRRTEEL